MNLDNDFISTLSASNLEKVELSYSILSKSDNSVIHSDKTAYKDAYGYSMSGQYSTTLTDINNIKFRIDKIHLYPQDVEITNVNCVVLDYNYNEIGNYSEINEGDIIEWSEPTLSDSSENFCYGNIELRFTIIDSNGTEITACHYIYAYHDDFTVINQTTDDYTKFEINPTVEDIKSRVSGLDSLTESATIEAPSFITETKKMMYFNVSITDEVDGATIRYHVLGWLNKENGEVEYYSDLVRYGNSYNIYSLLHKGLPNQTVFVCEYHADDNYNDRLYRYYAVKENGFERIDVPSFTELSTILKEEFGINLFFKSSHQDLAFTFESLQIDKDGKVNIIHYVAEGELVQNEITEPNGTVTKWTDSSEQYLICIRETTDGWSWFYVLDGDGNKISKGANNYTNGWGLLHSNMRENYGIGSNSFGVSENGLHIVLANYNDGFGKIAYTKGNTQEDFRANWWEVGAQMGHFYRGETTREEAIMAEATRLYPNDAEKRELYYDIINGTVESAPYFGFNPFNLCPFYPNGDCALPQVFRGIDGLYIRFIDRTGINIMKYPYAYSPYSLEYFATHCKPISDDTYLIVSQDSSGDDIAIILNEKEKSVEQFIICTSASYTIESCYIGKGSYGTEDVIGDTWQTKIDGEPQVGNYVYYEASTGFSSPQLEKAEFTLSILNKSDNMVLSSDTFSCEEGNDIYVTNKKDINNIKFRLDNIIPYPIDAKVKTIEYKIANRIDSDNSDWAVINLGDSIEWEVVDLGEDRYYRCLDVYFRITDKNGIVYDDALVNVDVIDESFKVFNLSIDNDFTEFKISPTIEDVKQKVSGLENLPQHAYISGVFDQVEAEGIFYNFETSLKGIRYFAFKIEEELEEYTYMYYYIVGWVYDDGTIEYYPEPINICNNTTLDMCAYVGLPNQRIIGIPHRDIYDCKDGDYRYYKVTDKGLVRINMPSYREIAEIFKSDFELSNRNTIDFLHESIQVDDNGFVHILGYTAEGDITRNEVVNVDGETIVEIEGSVENMVYITNKNNKWSWCYVLDEDGNKLNRQVKQGWKILREHMGCGYSSTGFGVAKDGSQVYIILGYDNNIFNRYSYTKGSTSENFKNNWWTVVGAINEYYNDKNVLEAEVMAEIERKYPTDETKRELYHKILRPDISFFQPFGEDANHLTTFYPNGDMALASYCIIDDINYIRLYDKTGITLVECDTEYFETWGSIDGWGSPLNNRYYALRLQFPDDDWCEIFSAVYIIDKKELAVHKFLINKSLKRTVCARRTEDNNTNDIISGTDYLLSFMYTHGEREDSATVYEARYDLLELIGASEGDIEEPTILGYLGDKKITKIYKGTKNVLFCEIQRK